MISYEPFWNTLKVKKVSTYALIHKHGISSGLIHRLKNNLVINTYTIDKLCTILDCDMQDIAVYIKKDTE